jgi:hypothetical protein
VKDGRLPASPGWQQQPGGGLTLAKAAVAEITNQPIHYAVILNFSGFAEVIDALGGLKYYNTLKDERLYSDLSQALLPLAEKVLDSGAFLQIDEPGLSAGFLPIKFAIKFVNELLTNIKDSAIDENKVSVHVCGSVNRYQLYNELLDLNVGVLSLGFSGNDEREKAKKVANFYKTNFSPLLLR